jgi:hypothetical protein
MIPFNTSLKSPYIGAFTSYKRVIAIELEEWLDFSSFSIENGRSQLMFRGNWKR